MMAIHVCDRIEFWNLATADLITYTDWIFIQMLDNAMSERTEQKTCNTWRSDQLLITAVSIYRAKKPPSNASCRVCTLLCSRLIEDIIGARTVHVCGEHNLLSTKLSII